MIAVAWWLVKRGLVAYVGGSFDPGDLKAYYHKAILKTLYFDFRAFAENIIKLLADEKLHKET